MTPRCAYPGCATQVHQLPGAGRPPKYCPEHRPRQNRKRDVGRAVAADDAEAAALLDPAGAYAGGGPAVDEALAERAAAIVMGLGVGGVEACRIVGLAGEPAELAVRADRIRAEHAGLMTPKLEHVTAWTSASLMLALLRAVGAMATKPPAALPATLAKLADVLDRLNGGVQPSYSNIVVELNLGAGEVPK